MVLWHARRARVGLSRVNQGVWKACGQMTPCERSNVESADPVAFGYLLSIGIYWMSIQQSQDKT